MGGNQWLVLALGLVVVTVAQTDYRPYPRQVADYRPRESDLGSSAFERSEPDTYGPSQPHTLAYQSPQVEYRPLSQQASPQQQDYGYPQPEFKPPQYGFFDQQPGYGNPQPTYPSQQSAVGERVADYGTGHANQPYYRQPKPTHTKPSGADDGFFSNGKGLGSSLYPTLGILNGLGTLGGNIQEPGKSPQQSGFAGFGGETDVLRALGPSANPFNQNTGSQAPQKAVFRRPGYQSDQEPYPQNPYPANPYSDKPSSYPQTGQRAYSPGQSDEQYGYPQSNQPFGRPQNLPPHGTSQSTKPYGFSPNHQQPFSLGLPGNSVDGRLSPYGSQASNPYQKQTSDPYQNQAPNLFQPHDTNSYRNQPNGPLQSRGPQPYQNQSPQQNQVPVEIANPPAHSQSPQLFQFPKLKTPFSDLFGNDIGQGLFSTLPALGNPKSETKQNPQALQPAHGYAPPQQHGYRPQSGGYPQPPSSHPQKGPFRPLQNQPQTGPYQPPKNPLHGNQSPGPQTAFNPNLYSNPKPSAFAKPPVFNAPAGGFPVSNTPPLSKPVPPLPQYPPKPYLPQKQTKPKQNAKPVATTLKPFVSPSAGSAPRRFGAGRSPVFSSPVASGGPTIRQGGFNTRTQYTDQNQAQDSHSTKNSGGSEESHGKVLSDPPKASSVPVSFGSSKTSSTKNEAPPPIAALPVKPNANPTSSSEHTTPSPEASKKTTTDKYNFLKPTKPGLANFGLENLFSFPNRADSGIPGANSLIGKNGFPSFTQNLGNERKSLF